MARHCAPVLLGKKPAALFVRPLWWDEHTSCLSLHSMNFSVLPNRGGGAVIFAYRPNLLAPVLENAAVRKTLRSLGYPGRTGFLLPPGDAAEGSAWTYAGLAVQLRHLAKRFRESEKFPHEIGFFLGYPPEDVLGFIRHRGARCKLCGMWKVYSDVEKARSLFGEYARCRQRLLEYIQGGGTIFDENLPAILAG
ncbi:MAG: DUF3793 family protein [Treponema sp.]|nr:DUF3793 family protein [Treponema sp.]